MVRCSVDDVVQLMEPMAHGESKFPSKLVDVRGSLADKGRTSADFDDDLSSERQLAISSHLRERAPARRESGVMVHAEALNASSIDRVA